MNYSEVEAKVREATSDDAWGPHGSLMHEIAQYTYTYEYYPEVLNNDEALNHGSAFEHNA